MWFMVLPNRKTCSQHGTQPVGDLLLMSSSTRVCSTGDFGNLAGAEKEPAFLVMGTLEKSNIQVWVAEQGCF
jgi:hypothetical protein